MEPTADAAAPLLISAVTGMGGIGKTALAVEAAHHARVRGWFPGGFLFVDLRGYDDNPVTADQGVLALLDAMGIRGTELPPTAARQYDTYRTLLARRRDRMLLILDNASDPSQYLPLLPGTDQHQVLITTRERPDALPVRVIDLEALEPDDSAALVTRALQDADERDERAQREPAALRELAAFCGHLPLALQIAAAMLRRRRLRDIASLVTEIREADDATAVLDRGSPGTDLYGRSLALRPVLETSYRRLPPDQAGLLRLLALAPGTDIGTEAVAALADRNPVTALAQLEELAATYLVTPVRGPDGSASGLRWRLHDLVRMFAVGVVAGDAALREEGEAARERVLEYYLRVAEAADGRLRWLPGRSVPERFADRGQALAWLDGERAGLVAAALWAREDRFADMAVRLAACLAEYFEWRRYSDEWVTVCRAAQEATQRAGDRAGEAAVRNTLGGALLVAGRAQEAIEVITHARDLYRAVWDRRGVAMAWSNLGIALLETGQVDAAFDAQTRARDLYQTTADGRGEAGAWNVLGIALRQAGRVKEAFDAHTRARDLYHTTGDRHRGALAWTNLGHILQETGRDGEAIQAYSKALETYKEFEDWYRAGQTLMHLALAHEKANRPAAARAQYLQAAQAFTRADTSAEATQARTRAGQIQD